MFKIFCTYICWVIYKMQHLEVSDGVRHIYRPMGPDGLFVSQRTGNHSAGIHVPFTNCFVFRWFCVVHDPKPPLHSHNWLSFGKFQDTERFLIHCERHFLHDYPLAVKPGSMPRLLVQKKLGEILYLLICSFLPCLSWLLRSRVRKSRRDLWINLYKFSQGSDSNKYKFSLNSCSAIDRFYRSNSYRRVRYRFGRGRVRKTHTKRCANRTGGESNPVTFWSRPAGGGTSFYRPAL